MNYRMSVDELLNLPVSVDLVTAGRAFGLGRTISYELAQAGKFPCTVRKLGERYRVSRSEILGALGVDPADLGGGDPNVHPRWERKPLQRRHQHRDRHQDQARRHHHHRATRPHGHQDRRHTTI
jgi:hypothetical protein